MKKTSACIFCLVILSICFVFAQEGFGTYKKGKVENKMAENDDALVKINGADIEDISKNCVQGSIIRSKWYTKNDYEHRDSAYEEILHMLHDYGIGTERNPGIILNLQKEIYKAMKNSPLKNKYYWNKKGLLALK